MVDDIGEGGLRVRLLLDDGSTFLADIGDCVPSNEVHMGVPIVVA